LTQFNTCSEIIPATSTEEFNSAVRDLVLRELEGLDPAAVLAVKKLIKAGLHEKNNPDAVNLRESYGAPWLSLTKSTTLQLIILLSPSREIR
jgi:Delta3-Delta2-enoyl-CoA isomerase